VVLADATVASEASRTVAPSIESVFLIPTLLKTGYRAAGLAGGTSTVPRLLARPSGPDP
jgi:hypothetical protein